MAEGHTMDALKSPSNSDLDYVRLAREIAMDILPIETILKQYDISDETWSKLQLNTKFMTLLGSEVESWSSALNTYERVKVKSAAMLEEWLPTLHVRMVDDTEALPAVIEAGKMLAKIAGLGGEKDTGGVVGERFVINISMGPKADPLEFAKEVTSRVTIEHEPQK
jgi:hypothetical protein